MFLSWYRHRRIYIHWYRCTPAYNYQTVSTILVFILAMLLHSSVQLEAQQELDRVIGRSRLPELEDRESLPYITAILYEVLRYRIMESHNARMISLTKLSDGAHLFLWVSSINSYCRYPLLIFPKRFHIDQFWTMNTKVTTFPLALS